jgi:transposase IS116/IS110/IS902 family protein
VLSPRIRLLIEDLRAEWRALDERIAAFDTEFVRMARDDEAVRRLMTIPGIGMINATALVAAVGNAGAFGRGRDMAAWLGLTPRQMTTGGRPRLLGISKRGNRYLRKNLIHGARAVLPYPVARETPLGRWARGLLARAHKNVVVVALANSRLRTGRHDARSKARHEGHGRDLVAPSMYPARPVAIRQFSRKLGTAHHPMRQGIRGSCSTCRFAFVAISGQPVPPMFLLHWRRILSVRHSKILSTTLRLVRSSSCPVGLIWLRPARAGSAIWANAGRADARAGGPVVY